MRCKNCGWNNPDGVKRCEKCHQPLVSASGKDGEHPVQGNLQATVKDFSPKDCHPRKVNLKATVKDAGQIPNEDAIQYDLFISYSRKDSGPTTEKILSALRDNNITYWIDLEGIYSGDSFAAVIHDNMQASSTVLFISSKASNQSDWVMREIALAVEFKKRIIPFRIDDEPFNREIALYLAALDAITYDDRNSSKAIGHLIDSILALKRTSTAVQHHPERPAPQKTSHPRRAAYILAALTIILILILMGAVFFLLNRKGMSSDGQYSIYVDKANIEIGNVDSITTHSSANNVPGTSAETPFSPTETENVQRRTNNAGTAASNSNGKYIMTGNCMICNIDGAEIKLRRINGGSFKLGDSEGAAGEAKDDEKPVLERRMSTFFISETEITTGMWNRVMKTGGEVSSTVPKTSVSYLECLAFLDALNAMTGLEFNLPTEAQWEYAAKKTDGSGLFDMSGNAAEWCRDWYGRYTSSESTNPEGPYSGRERVVRGGSAVDGEELCRVTARSKMAPASRSEFIGFRIVFQENS